MTRKKHTTLTPEERWHQAAMLLTRLGAESAKATRVVGEALELINKADRAHAADALSYNKDARKAVEAFNDSLKRVRNTAKELPPIIREDFGPPFDVDGTFLASVEGWIEMCEAVLDSHRTEKPRRRDGLRMRQAADLALLLLGGLNKEPTTARDDCFLKLAAILYGDTAVDLSRYCREALKGYRTGLR
jgi:hypothetical protein